MKLILLVFDRYYCIVDFLWFSVDAGLSVGVAQVTSVFQLNTVTPSQEMIGYVGTMYQCWIQTLLLTALGHRSVQCVWTS